MGPIKALDSVFSNYATMRGRASRSEFWWYTLMHGIITAVVITVDLKLFDPMIEPAPNLFSIFAITFTWFAITVIPNITVAVRRLHDSGLSGFAYLVTFIPFIGAFLFIYFMVKSSSRDDNIYGPPPFGPRGSPTGSFETDGTYKPATKSNAYAGYALLAQENGPKSAEHIAAQRAEVSDYYRTHVLGQSA